MTKANTVLPTRQYLLWLQISECMPLHGWLALCVRCDGHTDEAGCCPWPAQHLEHADAAQLQNTPAWELLSVLSAWLLLLWVAWQEALHPPSYIKITLSSHLDSAACSFGWIYLFVFNKCWSSPLPFSTWNQAGGEEGTLGAMTSNHNLVLSPASRFLAALLLAHTKQMMKAGSYGHISWCIPWLREKASPKQAVHWPVQSILSIHLFPVLSLPKFSALGSNGRGSFSVFAECLAQLSSPTVRNRPVQLLLTQKSGISVAVVCSTAMWVLRHPLLSRFQAHRHMLLLLGSCRV